LAESTPTRKSGVRPTLLRVGFRGLERPSFADALRRVDSAREALKEGQDVTLYIVRGYVRQEGLIAYP
jgi:hypothetical protein